MNARVVRILAAVGVVIGLVISARADAPDGRYTITNGAVYDTKTKLTWQQGVPSTKYAWDAARTYCSGLDLVGTGWRLPTVKELQTIVDESRQSPSVDPTAFPSTPSAFFWSSSPYFVSSSSSYAWLVSFELGFANHRGLSTAANVRCVH
jgi:hypothetical protein